MNTWKQAGATATWLRAVVVALVVILLMSSCGGFLRERVCGEGEYPVRLKHDRSGQPSACVEDGETPEHPYTTFPHGQTPTYVDLSE